MGSRGRRKVAQRARFLEVPIIGLLKVLNVLLSIIKTLTISKILPKIIKNAIYIKFLNPKIRFIDIYKSNLILFHTLLLQYELYEINIDFEVKINILRSKNIYPEGTLRSS